jgi:hypothetical protein
MKCKHDSIAILTRCGCGDKRPNIRMGRSKRLQIKLHSLRPPTRLSVVRKQVLG